MHLLAFAVLQEMPLLPEECNTLQQQPPPPDTKL
jgi:hypothetical protein